MTGSKKSVSSAPMFSQLNMLTISQVYEKCVMVFMFKLHVGYLPPIICNMFTRNYSTNTIVTRQAFYFRLPLYKTSNAYNGVTFKGVKLWNENFKKFDIHCSIHSFKRQIHSYLLSRGFNCGFNSSC